MDEGVLDSYEFAVKRAFEEAGMRAKSVFEDLGDILGVGTGRVEGYFEYLKEEIDWEKDLNEGKSLLITLNLGEIIESEVATTCKDLTFPLKSPAICTNLPQTCIPSCPALPSDSSSASEDSTAESKGLWESIWPNSGLYQTLIPSPSGVFISVLTANRGIGERFPEKWAFLLKNEVNFPTPYVNSGKQKQCKCRFGRCSSDFCPCAGQLSSQLTHNEGKLQLNLPSSGYFHIQACTSSCHCVKSACCLHFLTKSTQQSRSVLTCIAPKHWALFSFDAIAACELVLEVTGEVVGEAEHVGKQGYFEPLLSLEPPLYLRTRQKGSLARFLTHSCGPNLSVLRVTPGVAWLETRLLLYSNRPIASQEELTVNFDQLLNLPFRIRCECGSPACQGEIGPPPSPN